MHAVFGYLLQFPHFPFHTNHYLKFEACDFQIGKALPWSRSNQHSFFTIQSKLFRTMRSMRLRRPDDFHVHLRDGNSMV